MWTVVHLFGTVLRSAILLFSAECSMYNVSDGQSHPSLMLEAQMSEKLEQAAEVQEVVIRRPKRAKLTAEESLKRMESFPERKEQIVAAVRKSKNRGLSS
jgi:hypothetical protein